MKAKDGPREARRQHRGPLTQGESKVRVRGADAVTPEVRVSTDHRGALGLTSFQPVQGPGCLSVHFTLKSQLLSISIPSLLVPGPARPSYWLWGIAVAVGIQARVLGSPGTLSTT